jgi:hypothetical protein
VWPANGVLPAQQYVFVTASRDALLIRLPTKGAEAAPSAPIRIDLHNQMRPSVSVKIAPAAERPGFIYTYTVQNASSAVDSIGMWELIVPPGVHDQIKMEFAGGRSAWVGGAMGDALGRQAELAGAPAGAFGLWFSQSPGARVRPGGASAGFTTQSPLAPGFTTAYFGSGDWVNIDQSFPPEVFRQLQFYNDPVWGKPHILTIGPMFLDGTPLSAVAENFISGLLRLLAVGRIREDAWVNEVLQALQQVKKGVPPGSCKIRAVPNPGAEVEVMQAIALSLRLPQAEETPR